ncbi:hypothetical protein LCGC14_2848750, partial [marine sediment metagenome]
DAWTERISLLWPMWQSAADVDNLAEKQADAIAEAMMGLSTAVDAMDRANGLADQGKAIMQDVSTEFVFSVPPFLSLDQDPDFLKRLVQQLAMRWQSELARVASDPQEELELQAERKARYTYRHQIDKAAKDFRQDERGQVLWGEYRTYIGELQNLRESASTDDKADMDLLEAGRKQAQSLLDTFYDGVAEFAGLDAERNLNPRVGGV